MAAAPAHVGDLAEARDRVRWFPALVGNHVVDLVNKYDRDDLPEELTRYIRGRQGYDYLHHAEVGSSNAEFVTDDVVDRFSLVGSADDVIGKLHELEAAGVDQFNIYLMNGDEDGQLDIWAREIIPGYRASAASSVPRGRRSGRPAGERPAAATAAEG